MVIKKNIVRASGASLMAFSRLPSTSVAVPSSVSNSHSMAMEVRVCLPDFVRFTVCQNKPSKMAVPMMPSIIEF